MGKEQNNKKIYLVILVILILLLVVYFFLPSTEVVYDYLIVDDEVVTRYHNGKYYLTDGKRVDKNQYYKMYYEEEAIGYYYIDSVNSNGVMFYYHDSSDKANPYSFKKPYVAVTKNVDYVPVVYEELEDQDFSEAISLMNLSDTEGLVLDGFKIRVDLNNDSQEETIYTVSYLDMDNYEISFSLVYLKIGNELQVLEKSKAVSTVIDEDDFVELGMYRFITLVDFDKDKNYEIVLEYSDEDDTLYSVYYYQNGMYSKIVMEEE